jgi:hypothetical protein
VAAHGEKSEGDDGQQATLWLVAQVFACAFKKSEAFSN